MKERTFNLSNIDELTLYTGTNGRRGCSCNCPGCSQTNYGEQHAHNFHQGTLTQIQEIINLLPNLKKAYILGNPDCSVDTVFCSEAAKLFIKHKIHVMFSTSGIGGVKTLKQLLERLDLSFIDYISFSIDSIYPKTESLLKGTNIEYDTLLKGIEYCQALGIPIKIQPTIWQINQNSCIEIMEFFNSKYNIDWFTFHVGSLEGVYPRSPKTCQHVMPDRWHNTSQEIIEYAKLNNLHVYVPLIFLTENEYEIYKQNYIPHCQNPNPTNLQIWMEQNLQATFYPILAGLSPEQFTTPFAKYMTIKQPNNNDNSCIARNLSLGEKLAKEFKNNYAQNFHYVCRYYKTII